MTRLFVSLALVLALAVAAFGAAATLSVNAGNLQAGNVAVGQCDSNGVDVAFTTTFQNGDIYVTGVTVSGIDGACNNRTLTVWLTDSGNNSIATGSKTISSTTELVGVTPAVKASDVYAVYVLIS
jgi:sugar/nucleoside kinase (ribokinase family)